MTWPRRYGGAERTFFERYVVTEELLAAGAPVSAHWIADRQSGPLLLRYGTEAQRQRFLPPITRGESYFSIGMSEPDSGSDLASVRTSARKVDGGYVVNGTKVWTTDAHRNHFIIALVRTDAPGQSRHEGSDPTDHRSARRRRAGPADPQHRGRRGLQRSRVHRLFRAGRATRRSRRQRLGAGDERIVVRAQRSGAVPVGVSRAGRIRACRGAIADRSSGGGHRTPRRASDDVAADVDLGRRHAAGRRRARRSRRRSSKRSATISKRNCRKSRVSPRRTRESTIGFARRSRRRCCTCRRSRSAAVRAKYLRGVIARGSGVALMDTTQLILDTAQRMFTDHCDKALLDRAEQRHYAARLWDVIAENGLPLLGDVGRRRHAGRCVPTVARCRTSRAAGAARRSA